MIDKGYYKDIPQLAKPKGNERQGFRGDDAYGGGDSVAGGGDQGWATVHIVYSSRPAPT